MKIQFRKLIFSILALVSPVGNLLAQNQTDTLSDVLPEELLPFSLEISEASFKLPAGLQSFASAVYDDKWILIGGRTNGLHGFNNVGNNFPPQFQNTLVYVIDPKKGTTAYRDLKDASSKLDQEVIDTLSVTASQFYQKGSTLYMVGGYGINSLTGEMGTKSSISAINLKKIIHWVEHKQADVKNMVRQAFHPALQVTGGELFRKNGHTPFLLTLGQNFQGLYNPGSNGTYTQQIRTFWMEDNGKDLNVYSKISPVTFPDYRRRDLNVVPIIRHNKSCFVALGGVFTLTGGVWTIPIIIRADGTSFELDQNDPLTFKQAMNQYNCANFGFYSAKSQEMFVSLAGGISYGYFSGGVFQTDSEIPFINQVTTIKMDKHDQFSQYLMNAEYPFIESTGSNPGNQLLFGAESAFIPAKYVKAYKNGVIELDKIKKPTIVGYIVGGIMSTLPNTNVSSDSTASPYVFQVTCIPK